MKEGYLSDFNCDLAVGARQADLCISETADALGFFTHNHLLSIQRKVKNSENSLKLAVVCGQKCLAVVRGQMSMGRLV